MAATRAGACLVVTQRSGKYAHLNPWKSFEEHLEGYPPLADPGRQRPPSQSVVNATIGDLETAKKEIDERWQAVVRPTYALRAAKKIAVSEEALRFPLFFAAEPDEENPVGEHGTEWGTVIHLLLETAIRQPTADLRQLAYDKLGEEELEAENRETLAELAVETVSKVKRSAIWQRAVASGRRLVEVPFETLWPSDLGVPTVVRGVIDLIFHEPAGWVIVDYKTHHGATANQASLVDKYGPQILLYADIWQKLVGEPVHEVGLYFTQIDRYVAVQRPS